MQIQEWQIIKQLQCYNEYKYKHVLSNILRLIVALTEKYFCGRDWETFAVEYQIIISDSIWFVTASASASNTNTHSISKKEALFSLFSCPPSIFPLFIPHSAMLFLSYSFHHRFLSFFLIFCFNFLNISLTSAPLWFYLLLHKFLLVLLLPYHHVHPFLSFPWPSFSLLVTPLTHILSYHMAQMRIIFRSDHI